MDKIDYKILSILQENARTSNAKIAKEVGLSPPSTLERLKKLEESGVISKYETKYDIKKLDVNLTIIVAITLVKHQKDNISLFLESIEALSEVIEYYHLTGKFDYLLKVHASSVEAFRDFLTQKLVVIPVVDKAESFMVMDNKNFGIDFDEFIKN